MLTEKEVAKAAEEISNETNLQIMSHSVMALKQYVEDRLKKDSDANQTFERKLRSLYGEDVINAGDSSYKAYVYLECTDNLIVQGKNNFNNFARIYSKIDKVLSVEDNSISYALHLRITSCGKGTSSYDSNGFISESCGRFAVGHDIGHAVLNLDDLINDATTNDNQSIIKEKKDCDTARHYEVDFFSYILSDLRDFYLLELDGKFDLGKALESYSFKAISKFLGSVLKETISETSIDEEQNEEQFFNKTKDKIEDKIKERLGGIGEVFKKSQKLYDDSLQYTMSHPIIALNKRINSQFQLDIDDKLEKLRNELKKYELKKETIKFAGDFSKDDIKNLFSRYKILMEMGNLNNEMENLEKEKPGINIHLISREEYSEELTIDCYNRRDENSKKNFYCFEIVIKKFSNKERNDLCIKICQAIGFIYFGYKLIIKRFEENNNLGHLIVNDMQKSINDFDLDKKEINDFANKLCELRKVNFEKKRNDIKKETKLKNRLASYV
jgi:hypothetical protein